MPGPIETAIVTSSIIAGFAVVIWRPVGMMLGCSIGRAVRKLIWSGRYWIGQHIGIAIRGRCVLCEALVPRFGRTPHCPRPICEVYEP